MFAQFFIAPLFTDSCTERELNAVDSENRKNLQSDMWRIFQLERHLSVPNSSFNRFGTGSMTSLKVNPEARGVDVRAELLAFHKRYYSANIMSLCLLGRESLDQLEQWARQMFSAIPDNQAMVPVDTSLPLDSRFLGVGVLSSRLNQSPFIFSSSFSFPHLTEKGVSSPCQGFEGI